MNDTNGSHQTIGIHKKGNSIAISRLQAAEIMILTDDLYRLHQLQAKDEAFVPDLPSERTAPVENPILFTIVLRS